MIPVYTDSTEKTPTDEITLRMKVAKAKEKAEEITLRLKVAKAKEKAEEITLRLRVANSKDTIKNAKTDVSASEWTTVLYKKLKYRQEETVHTAVAPHVRYYKFLFCYSWYNRTVRYIPVDEGHKCYFKVCDDTQCPAFKNNTMHQKGMNGCVYGFTPCTDTRCGAWVTSRSRQHLFGCHKRCIGNEGRQPLPSLAMYCSTNRIPDGEIVYHFDKEDFGDNHVGHCIPVIRPRRR